MANEIRGILCEAAVVAALEMVNVPYTPKTIWGETPDGLLVCQSDITIFKGRKLDGIFQVTSSGYAGNYQMKFWRDLGELFEIRRVFPEIAIFNVIFESEVKTKLVQVLRNLTNGVIEVTKLESGRAMVKHINELAKSEKYKSASSEERLSMLKYDVNEKELRELASEISKLLQNQRPTWKLNHHPATSFSEPKINLRRAFIIGRLFCKSDHGFSGAKELFESVSKNKIVKSSQMLDTYCKIGLCSKVTGGVRVTQKDLVAAINHYGVNGYIERAEAVFSDAVSERIDAYAGAIQNLHPLATSWYNSLSNQFEAFCDPKRLSVALSKNFDDFSYLMDGGSRSFEPWIFRRLLDVIRASREKHFCIGVPTFDAVFRKNKMQPLRFTISEYLAGRSNLSVPEVEMIAMVLAGELRKEESFFQKHNFDSFFSEVARSELTQRLYAYRGILPAQSLVRKYYNVNVGKITPPILSQFGVFGAGGCMGEINGKTLSIVQNASEGGVGHKINEVVGRACLLSLKMNVDNGLREFYFDPLIKERNLYVDGPWKKKDLEAVANGAFTKIISLS